MSVFCDTSVHLDNSCSASGLGFDMSVVLQEGISATYKHTRMHAHVQSPLSSAPSLPPRSPMRTMQGFVRKRVLPVLFPAGEAQPPPSPILDASCVTGDAGNGQVGLLCTWDSENADVAPPGVGSKIVDRTARDEKLGAVIAVSSGESRKERPKTKSVVMACFP